MAISTKEIRAQIIRLLLFAALSPPAVAGAQQVEAFAWPPIDPEELALKDNPAKPGSAALILERRVEVDDPKSFETQYYRIKIFNDEGKKYADVEIPYVEGVGRVEEIRARTIEPDGKVVGFSGEVFDKTVVKTRRLKFQAKTFALPDVRVGSILVYSYKVRWHEKAPDVIKNPGQYIIKESFTIPAAHWTIQEDLFTRRAHFSIRPFTTAHLESSWAGLPDGKRPEIVPGGTTELDLENVPALEKEKYMPPEGAVRSRVDFYYAFGLAGGFSVFWRDQGKDRGEEVDKFIGKHKDVRQVAQETVSPGDPPLTKLRKLYARAQQIRNLSYERTRTAKEERHEDLKENKNASEVLGRGYGTGHEINLLFAALARASGFDAYYVRAAGRGEYFFDENLPEWDQLNSDVVEVKTASQDLYFDPGTIYCPFDLLPWGETGVRGVRLDKENAAFVKTTDPASADAVIGRKAALELDPKGNLNGKLHVSFAGQEALDRRLDARDEDDTEKRKALEDEVKGWLPEGSSVKLVKATAWEGSEQPLEADFEIDAPGFGSSTGRRLLVPVGVFQSGQKNPFQHAERTYAVYFHYPWQEVDDVTIGLPNGYEVETLPKPQKVAPDYSHYEASCERTANALHWQRRFVMNGEFFKTAYYQALRAYYTAVDVSDEQQAVLRAMDPKQANTTSASGVPN